MAECCETPQKHHAAIYEKYTDKRFKRAANFVENEMERGFRVSDIPPSQSSIISADRYDSKQSPGYI
jgi:G2/mitotic-specific cyclin 3/4